MAERVEIKTIPLVTVVVVIMGLITLGAGSILTRLTKAESTCDLAKEHIARDDERSARQDSAIHEIKGQIETIKETQSKQATDIEVMKGDIRDILDGIDRIEKNGRHRRALPGG